MNETNPTTMGLDVDEQPDGDDERSGSGGMVLTVAILVSAALSAAALLAVLA